MSQLNSYGNVLIVIKNIIKFIHYNFADVIYLRGRAWENVNHLNVNGLFM